MSTSPSCLVQRRLDGGYLKNRSSRVIGCLESSFRAKISRGSSFVQHNVLGFLTFWNRRNKFRVHKPTKKPDRIASFARGFLEEFRTCQTSLSPSSRPTMKPQVRWSKPRRGYHKINYDGAIFNNSDEASIGVVV
jgi:hypothetical protein